MPSACKPGRTASVASACTRKMFSVVPLNGFALSLIVFPTSLAILPSLSFIIFILRSLESPIAIPTSAKFVSVVNDASPVCTKLDASIPPNLSAFVAVP